MERRQPMASRSDGASDRRPAPPSPRTGRKTKTLELDDFARRESRYSDRMLRTEGHR